MARWEGWNFADGNTGGGRGDDNRKSAPGGGPARRTAGGHGTHIDHQRAVLSGSHFGEWFQEAAAVRSLEGFTPGRANNPQRLTVGFRKGSFPERNALGEAPVGIDSVFHLADRVRVPEKWRVWLSEKRSRRVYPSLSIWSPIHVSPISSVRRCYFLFEGGCVDRRAGVTAGWDGVRSVGPAFSQGALCEMSRS